MDGWSPAMYDEFGGSTNGQKYGEEGDDSTINDEEDGPMRAGYTNNYGYGTTEMVHAPTDSENERGAPPQRYPKEVTYRLPVIMISIRLSPSAYFARSAAVPASRISHSTTVISTAPTLSRQSLIISRERASSRSGSRGSSVTS